MVAMLGVGMNQVIGLAWQHPRPFMIGIGHTWIPHAADSSFPSDHMTVLAGVGLPLLLEGALWFGLTTMIVGLWSLGHEYFWVCISRWTCLARSASLLAATSSRRRPGAA
jgi:membrane-associated phospholipid phosphatase